MAKNTRYEYSSFSVPSVKYAPAPMEPKTKPETTKGKVRSAIDSVFGVDRFGMTGEEIKAWDTKVGITVGLVSCTGSLGIATYLAVKVINLIMGVG